MKLSAFVALLSASSASAFVAPRPAVPSRSTLQASSGRDDPGQIARAATVAAASIATAALSSPLAALAEDDDYVYGAVNAPGGIGLAAGLGVLAILTAAVPVILAPGEDAFNEMKDRDEGKWGK
ncbi:hypothetical protein ACHAWF_008890 [Thalassiosira exigua]